MVGERGSDRRTGIVHTIKKKDVPVRLLSSFKFERLALVFSLHAAASTIHIMPSISYHHASPSCNTLRIMHASYVCWGMLISDLDSCHSRLFFYLSVGLDGGFCPFRTMRFWAMMMMMRRAKSLRPIFASPFRLLSFDSHWTATSRARSERGRDGCVWCGGIRFGCWMCSKG